MEKISSLIILNLFILTSHQKPESLIPVHVTSGFPIGNSKVSNPVPNNEGSPRKVITQGRTGMELSQACLRNSYLTSDQEESKTSSGG